MSYSNTVNYCYEYRFFKVVRETDKFMVLQRYKTIKMDYYDNIPLVMGMDSTEYYKVLNELEPKEYKISKNNYKALNFETLEFKHGQYYTRDYKLILQKDLKFYENKNIQNYCLQFKCITGMLREIDHWTNVHIKKYPNAQKTMDYNIKIWNDEIKEIADKLSSHNTFYELHKKFIDEWILDYCWRKYMRYENDDQTTTKDKYLQFIAETYKLIKKTDDEILISESESEKTQEKTQEKPQEEDDEDNQIKELEKKINELKEKKKAEKQRKIAELKKQIELLENE